MLRDVEPWAEPVDGVDLAERVASLIGRHVYMPTASTVAVTLWICFSWVFKSFHIAPLLLIRSPAPRCGKTSLLTIVASIVRRPLVASSVTPAALFRAIDALVPSILIDEADLALRGARSDLRAILNSGHRKGAFVLRAIPSGEGGGLRQYNVFSPKVLAGIGRFAATVEDRSIIVQLDRLPHDIAMERLREDHLESEAGVLAAQLCRWAIDFQRDPRGTPDELMLLGLDDRAVDNWLPLVEVAECIGGRWPELARQAAIELSALRETEEQDLGINVLRDVARIFQLLDVDFIPTRELISQLTSVDETVWAEMGTRLTSRRLAMLLAPFSIRSRQPFRGANRGYDRASFIPSWSRYLSPDQWA